MSGQDEIPTHADQLISAAQGGSMVALNSLLVLLSERLRTGLKNLKLPGKSPSRSNVDFVQDTLVRVREQFERFPGATFDELLLWSWQILHRRHRETRRNRRTRYSESIKRKIWSAVVIKKNLPNQDRLGKPVEEEFERCEEIERVYCAFRQSLTADERNIIDLHLVDGLSYETIASGVNRSGEAVRKTYQRALERIRKQLESDGQHSA